LAWARHHPQHGRFYGIANFALREAVVPADALAWAGMATPRPVFGAEHLHRYPGVWTVDPYSVVWFVDDADTALQPRVV
jgi:hypothetical protein